MAVYTKLTFEQINNFIKENYQIGQLKSFKEIIDGIDNSNFIINTDINGSESRYILTIFEKRMENQDLPFFMNLKLHLAKQGICCPRPIVNNNAQLISKIQNKPAAIVTFLEGATLKPNSRGYYPNITENHCFQVGKNLALLHNAASGFKGYRENDLGVRSLNNLFNKIDKADLDNYKKDLGSQIKQYLDFLNKNWNDNLDSATVHVDLFPDNVFFDNQGNLSGIIDFYFAANDLLIYDFAVIVNAWCFDADNNFNRNKFDSAFAGYQQLRKFKKSELEFLDIALIGASARFLLTRLYDLFNTPKDSLVKVKDPEEYLQKIGFFFKSFKLKQSL